jgi:hypothetical protein
VTWLERIRPLWNRNTENKIRVVVLGNCQARPLATILPLYNASVEVTSVGVVHLLQNDEEPYYEDLFRKADLILAQPVSDTYQCTFVRASELKRFYGDKVLFWINLYFRGYNPELFYMRLGNQQTLRGPLGDYHCRTFFEGWKRNFSIEKTIAMHNDISFNQEHYSTIPETSLAELRRREQMADITITSIMEPLLWRQRLFFTFNHPNLLMLQMVATEILKVAGIKIKEPMTALETEPLGLIQPPINPWIVATRGIEEKTNSKWTGLKVEKINSGNVLLGRQINYSLTQLVQCFFKIYDANRELIYSKEWA